MRKLSKKPSELAFAIQTQKSIHMSLLMQLHGQFCLFEAQRNVLMQTLDRIGVDQAEIMKAQYSQIE